LLKNPAQEPSFLVMQRFPALSFRNYRIFWIGQFISLIGTWMQSTTQTYLAYRLTNQPIYLGAVGFATAFPALLFMLPGGVIVERLNKKKIITWMQAVMMIQAFTMAGLSLAGIITIWHILALSALLGLASSFEITARQAMIGELVDKEALPNAIALNSTIFNAARILGPSLAAPFLVLIKNNGEGWAFFANGVSYLFVILSLLLIQTQSKPSVNPSRLHGMEDFMEGQKYIRKTTIVLFLILMVVIPSFIGFPFSQLLPVFATDVLRLPGEAATMAAARNSLLVTFQGVGALVAALFLAIFSTMRKKGFLLMMGQYAFSLGLIGLSLSKTLNFTLFLMIVIGWGVVTQLALTNTLIQLSVPDSLRGRVLATYLWVTQGITPFGSLYLGWLAQEKGAPAAVMVSGVACLVGYALFHFFRPSIHQT
jgi:MFS family permease